MSADTMTPEETVALARGGGQDEASDLSSPWPEPLNDAALHGLTGEVVRAIESHTEADPAAIVVQFLLGFGNLAGRYAYYQVEADRHYMNINAVLVGATAKGRKGTSAGQALRPLRMLDDSWSEDCLRGGLSSGEGLIWAVRDEIRKAESVKQHDGAEGEGVVEVAGVADKRLLILEPEFASTLRVIGRQGNVLSAIVRQAWDSGDLQVLTKNSPARATGAHISIVGHITKEELLRRLDSTEAGNGFANRFLWVCVRRSKYLPEGGQLCEVDLAPVVRRLSLAADFAGRKMRLQFDKEALDAWYAIYPRLSDGETGLFGAVTSRGEAQVVRLGLIYALLDQSDAIRAPHLFAAIAVWEYVMASARFIFGDSLGDPVADEILRALRTREEGMTRTEISGIFGRNKPVGQINRALTTLAERGLVGLETLATDGRPAEVWFAHSIPRKKRN